MTALNTPMNMLHGPRWPNRIVMAPMTNQQSNADGSLHDDELRWVVARAKGGFGTILTCASHVSPEGQGWPGQLGIWNDALLPGLTRAAEALRAGGAVSLVQLHHGGRRARPDLSGLRALAPWTDPETGARALATDEVERLIEDHVSAAMRAQRAGFDGVEIHGAHGFLVSQFLDQKNAQRSDHFGGSFENRKRFLVRVLSGIRESTGAEFQVGVRLGPELRGTTLAEARELVAEVMASGLVDFVDLSMGDVFKEPAEPEHSGRPLLTYFAELPRHGVQLGVAGGVLSSADARRVLGMGADFVLLARGAVLHHDFAARALIDRGFEARSLPVSRGYLRNEFLSDRFIDYLDDGWPTFVS